MQFLGKNTVIVHGSVKNWLEPFCVRMCVYIMSRSFFFTKLRVVACLILLENKGGYFLIFRFSQMDVAL